MNMQELLAFYKMHYVKRVNSMEKYRYKNIPVIKHY